MGQYSMVDPTRSRPARRPPGPTPTCRSSVRGDAGGDARRRLGRARDGCVRRRGSRRRSSARAPGFRGADPRTPRVHAADAGGGERATCVGGAVNGGTAQIHQQLVFRPDAGARRAPETPMRGPLPRPAPRRIRAAACTALRRERGARGADGVAGRRGGASGASGAVRERAVDACEQPCRADPAARARSRARFPRSRPTRVRYPIFGVVRPGRRRYALREDQGNGQDTGSSIGIRAPG